MNIDLRGVFSGRVNQLPINEKFDFSALELNGTTPIASEVSVDCVIAKKADIVKIEGKASFLYKAPCDRCATETERAYEIPVDHIIVNSVENEDVKKELYEFIKMRKLIKRPLTNRALEMIINKLNTLSKDEKEQIKILDQSIINNWQNIYPIKEDERKSTGNIFRDIGIEEGIF